MNQLIKHAFIQTTEFEKNLHKSGGEMGKPFCQLGRNKRKNDIARATFCNSIYQLKKSNMLDIKALAPLHTKTRWVPCGKQANSGEYTQWVI